MARAQRSGYIWSFFWGRNMPKKTSSTGSELFIVDNSDEDWKVLRYLHDWCQLSKSIDIATGYFEIGGLLALNDEWQKVDSIRILMGDECSMRTKAAFETARRAASCVNLCKAPDNGRSRLWRPGEWRD